jgi:cycloartenol synthase
MICRWVEDPNSKAFKLHTERVYDFLWVAEDGMKMQVFKSSSFILLEFVHGVIY